MEIKKIEVIRTKKSLDGISDDKWEIHFHHSKQQTTCIDLSGDELQLLLKATHAALMEKYGKAEIS